ncbi:MAG: DedA family protein [Planctomyces sp.]|nr:DedA family protein [Planctomyces sp.]
MEILQLIWDWTVHLSAEKVSELATWCGPWLYAVLFAVIFCETGLVATPFLPGDSLLFLVGAVAGLAGSTINLPLMTLVLFAAAVLGDGVNYAIGKRLGPVVFSSSNSRWWNKRHLIEAQKFYEKYGAKTIVLARFVPIVRTFAPFVAGIGRMSYGRFAAYNVVGGALWVTGFLWAGYWLGSTFKSNLKIVIYGIVVVSVLPLAYEVLKARRERARERAAGSTV